MVMAMLLRRIEMDRIDCAQDMVCECLEVWRSWR